MRLKGRFETQDSYRCCFCCHVRTGTIFLGLFHLIVHLFVIAALIFASIHPEVLQQHAPKCPNVQFDNQLDKTDELHLELNDEFRLQRKMNREDMELAFVICLCMLTIILFLLYGVLKNRPGYMLPFFCLQVFDFCLSCLTIVGYLSYTPNIKIWLTSQGLTCIPGVRHLMEMDSQWLMMLCLLVFVLFLSVKAYLIGMVWSCYQFLKLRLVNNTQIQEYSVDPDTEVLLPPKYEEAIKQSQIPPPPYSS